MHQIFLSLKYKARTQPVFLNTTAFFTVFHDYLRWFEYLWHLDKYSQIFLCIRHSLLSMFALRSFEASDPPQLDAAVPLHLDCPFTSGIGRVTLQGNVTLHPLNDASTCYPKRRVLTFMSKTHIFHQMYFSPLSLIYSLLGAGCAVWHAVSEGR